MRFPDFLIIGAMKAGTTTLYADLDTNPEIFFPSLKEPAYLHSQRVMSPAGRKEYASHYRAATPEQRCGDASTSYTMLPLFPGVPGRARALLGSGLRVIYVVRDPVARIVSHHYHALRRREASPDINHSVRGDHRLLAFSRYAAQLAPWLRALGPDAVRVMCFEQMVKDRGRTAAGLSEFLGVTPRPELVNADVVFNRAEGLPEVSDLWTRVQHSRAYRYGLRNLMSDDLRAWFTRALLPRAPMRPPPPAPDTVRYIIDSLGPDCQRLQRLTGTAEPLWDLARLEREHVERWRMVLDH